jgi:hypothetical protein
MQYSHRDNGDFYRRLLRYAKLFGFFHILESDVPAIRVSEKGRAIQMLIRQTGLDLSIGEVISSERLREGMRKIDEAYMDYLYGQVFVDVRLLEEKLGLTISDDVKKYLQVPDQLSQVVIRMQ